MFFVNTSNGSHVVEEGHTFVKGKLQPLSDLEVKIMLPTDITIYFY